MAKKPVTPKSTKIAFSVRVADATNSVAFFPATDYIGKPMPFKKPQATCAMQVKDDNVAFSLLHLTKTTATKIASDVIVFPKGPLERLSRHAAQLKDLGPNEIITIMDEKTYHLSLHRDDAGIGRVELESIEGMEDPNGVWPETFELPRGSVRLDVYMRSPRVARVLAVGFIGHLGKPGDAETVTRATAKVLHSITQLADFSVLAGLESVSVPAGPSKWAQQAAALRRVEKDVATEVPVWLFSAPDDAGNVNPVATGSVVVTVDMQNANHSAGKLLCHYTPSPDIAEVFDAYRTVFDDQINIDLRQAIGTTDLQDITLEIILGSFEPATVERLETALKELKPLDLTPSMVRHHAEVAA